MNQCDGCRRGLPINEFGHHRGAEPWDIIACTAHLYESGALPMTDKLPELPEPVALVAQFCGEWRETVSAVAQPVFTAEQLRSFAEEAVRLERERILGILKSERLQAFFMYDSEVNQCDAYNAALENADEAIRSRSEEVKG